jgi:hypothetical protein
MLSTRQWMFPLVCRHFNSRSLKPQRIALLQHRAYGSVSNLLCQDTLEQHVSEGDARFVRDSAPGNAARRAHASSLPSGADVALIFPSTAAVAIKQHNIPDHLSS